MPYLEDLKHLTADQIREVMEIAKKCGCICHYADARHMFACCDAAYFRVDLVEKAIARNASAIKCTWCFAKPGEPCVDIQLGRWVAGYHHDRVSDSIELPPVGHEVENEVV